MSEIKPQPGGQLITENAKQYAQFTAEDIQFIKSRQKKKRRVIHYIIAIVMLIGIVFSAAVIISEILDVNEHNRKVLEGIYQSELYQYSDINYWEGLIPFSAGLVIGLFFMLGLIANLQEQKLELNNNKKVIYKGLVTKLSERSSVTGSGKNRDTDYYYYIHLGDEIRFENEKLYYELNAGDTIDVHISEKLNYILFKNIIKKKSVTDAMPEVIDKHGPILEIRYKQEVKSRIDFLSNEEIAALEMQKKRRAKRILIVGVILTILMGATAELNLYIDSYNLEETIQWRLGFWCIPLAFFALLFYRRTVPLSNDIHAAEKIIISEKLINKEESYSDAAKEYTYSIKGIREKLDVSKEIFNSIGAGDDFEIHNTQIRKKLLQLVVLKNGMKYKNPAIFKSK